jgi:group I intron endonuclease
MVNYKNGKIYKLVNSENEKIYIGSTCTPLKNRMARHLVSAKDPRRTSTIYNEMRRIGSDNFSIAKIERFPCNQRDQLEVREFQIMRHMLRQGHELLNSTIVFRKASEDHKLKMSIAQKGRVFSQESRDKMSLARKGKNLGETNPQFKRGCLIRSEATPSNGARWRFQWSENGKLRNKSFSVSKYTENGARRLAEKVQNQIYPLR